MIHAEQNMTIETLLSGYDNDIVLDWIKRLDFFSFYKSGLTGHLADSDSFVMDIEFVDKNDLLNTLRVLGLRFRLTDKVTPRLITGISYSSQDLKTPKNTSEEFHDIECNSKNSIKGFNCTISIMKGYINISIHRLPHEKDYFVLTECEFEKAHRIEKVVRDSGLEKRVTKENQKYKGYVDNNKLSLILK